MPKGDEQVHPECGEKQDPTAGDNLTNRELLEQILQPGDASEPAPEVARTKKLSGIQLRTASIFCAVFALIAAAALFFTDLAVSRGYQRMEQASDRYIAAQLAASDMESGSDYLTDRVRCFVVTGEMEYLEDFFREVDVTKTRDNAVENLEVLLAGRGSNALDSLNTALRLSNELVQIENLAMRLMVEARDYNRDDIPDEILDVEIPNEYVNLSPDELESAARNLVFDSTYMHYKDRIRENVNNCTQALIRSSYQELEDTSSRLSLLVNIQTVMTVLFLLVTLSIIVIVGTQVRKPLSRMVALMQKQDLLPLDGAEELRYVAETYNSILLENKRAREKLSHEASHDALTGLFNRGAYDMLMENVDTDHMALVLIDVDYFKQINDTYGHDMGDRILKRVADVLRQSFRSVDIICRFGGDEFVVVMTRANSSMKQLVLNKMNHANELLQNPQDDLPPVSLSVGVAFADRENPQGDIFKDADTALYRVKEAGRNGCRVYE